jgi:hypothetical protein
VTGIDGATYTVPDPEALADNTYYWHVQAIDQSNNASGYQAVPFSFTINTAAPSPPTDLAVRPGHHKCKLSWTNPSAQDFAGVMIRRNPWGVGAYPEYEGTPLGFPASEAEGTEVYVGMAQSLRDSSGTDTMPRNVYYYTIFSFDAVGNYSTASTAVQGMATNYWLGDIDGDGSVGMSDLVAFSTAFGAVQGGQGWNPFCDFGPSDTGLGVGIPLPDDGIDFEDLMIFALNYDTVGPVTLPPSVAGGAIEELDDLVHFGIASDEAGVISVMLQNKSSTLKGFRLVVDVGAGCEIAGVTRGSLLDDMENVFFGTIPRTNRSVEICAAALGADTPLRGGGEIARLHVKNGENGVIRVGFKEIDVRDLDNEKHELTVEEYDAPFIPVVAGLMQNYPNPFNPTTTIAYDVATAGRVTIEIFDVSGRLITTVVDEKKAPGRYRVDWTAEDKVGTSVSSGIYFYRMRTEDGVLTKKMVLLR